MNVCRFHKTGILCLAALLFLALASLPAAADNTVTVSGVILPSSVPVAAFTAIPTSGTAPLTVQFSDQSTNAPVSWKWEYRKGAGSWMSFSSDKNPSYTFSAAGSYSIRLTVTNSGGSDTETKTRYLTVAVPVKPVAAFSGIPKSGTAPLTVQFTDKSKNTPVTWKWEYRKIQGGRMEDRNGEPGAWTQFSTDKDPVFTFSSAGSYDIRLTVTNAGGKDVEIKNNYITARPAAMKPIARFSQDRHTGEAPLTVRFTDRSINAPASWNWQFGDGSSSGDQNPVHTYTSPGFYIVRERVSNDAGSDTTTGYVVVLSGDWWHWRWWHGGWWH